MGQAEGSLVSIVLVVVQCGTNNGYKLLINVSYVVIGTLRKLTYKVKVFKGNIYQRAFSVDVFHTLEMENDC